MSKNRTYITKEGVKVTIYFEKMKDREGSFWYYGEEILKVNYLDREVIFMASGDIQLQFEENGSYYKNSNAVWEALDRKLTDKTLPNGDEGFDAWHNNNWFDFRWRKVLSKEEWQRQLANVQAWREKLSEWRKAKKMTFEEYNDYYNSYNFDMGGDVCYEYDEALEGAISIIKEDEWWEE